MKYPAVDNNQESKKWPQLLATLSATIAVFATGCHSGWPAPSVPKLLSDEFPFEVSAEAASYITIIGHVGNIAGGFLGAFLVDIIGRKKTILLIALPQYISFFLIAMSYEVMELLYFGRIIGGLAEGMTFTIVPLYIAEIAEPQIRGALGTLISVTVIFGMVYVNVLGSYVSIELTASTFFIFPTLFLVIFWKMPESPYYLLMKNRQDEAEASLKFLRRKTSVSHELEILVKDVNRQMSESGTFKDIFVIDSNRKAFLLMVGTRIVQQMTGVSAFALYVQMLLREATDALDPATGATVLLFVQLCMAIISTLFVDKYGRKPLLLISTGAICINLFMQATYFILRDHSSVDVSVIDWFPLVMMIAFIIIFSIGLGAVVNILNSEIFSVSVKGKSVCLVNVVFALGMMGTTKFYQVTADNFGLTVPYCSFAIFSLFGVIFLYVFLPETKGKTLEQIQQKLKGRKSILSLSGKR